MGHKLALKLALGVLLVWLAVMALTLYAAALPPQAAGTVVAVFPPGADRNTTGNAVLRAGGAPLQQGWLGLAWQAHSDASGFVGRLQDGGAVLVLRATPAVLLMTGCVTVVR